MSDCSCHDTTPESESRVHQSRPAIGTSVYALGPRGSIATAVRGVPAYPIGGVGESAVYGLSHEQHAEAPLDLWMTPTFGGGPGSVEKNARGRYKSLKKLPGAPKDFDVSVLKSARIPSGVAGLNELLQFKGVRGPWLRQRITIEGKYWKTDCEGPPDYRCKYIMDEMFRVLKSDGSPTGKGERGETNSKQGGVVLPPAYVSDAKHHAKVARDETLPGKPQVIVASLAQNFDLHRMLFHVNHPDCGIICKADITVTGSLQEGCSEPTIKGIAVRRTDRKSGPSNRVDFILISRKQSAQSCLCKPFKPHRGQKVLPVVTTGCSKPFSYVGRWTWDRCDAPICKPPGKKAPKDPKVKEPQDPKPGKKHPKPGKGDGEQLIDRGPINSAQSSYRPGQAIEPWLRTQVPPAGP